MKRDHDSIMGDPSSFADATVVCCSCGVSMPPNTTMRCAQCLKSEVSIVDGISRQVVLPHCRNCDRYNKPPWMKCEPESRELLGICLKRIKGLSKDVRLVDAAFVWTEEHSKRIRVKITVQKEVASSSVLQQTMVVEFQVVNQQCEDCQKSFTPHTFNAIVQVRQKVAHRRTFCYLEQLILKHDAHDKVISLKENREGLDFHFGQRSHAQRFTDFVAAWVPTKTKNSKHLCSHDANSNTYNYKYTILADLCPVCVDDVVYIPQGFCASLSGASPLMLCYKISNAVRLVDPVTLRGYDVPATEFWKKPLEPVLSRQHLIEYIVLNVEPAEKKEAGTPMKMNIGRGRKFELADVEVARSSDLGSNDTRMIVRSHLGAELRPGNHVLGYDLRSANVPGIDERSLEAAGTDIFLVKRHFLRRRGKRAWELRRLDKERDEGAHAVNDDDDMEAMQRDLEEDSDLRRNVNFFRKEKKGSAAVAAASSTGDGKDKESDEDCEEDDDEAPEVPLAELLEGLELNE